MAKILSSSVKKAISIPKRIKRYKIIKRVFLHFNVDLKLSYS